MSEAGAAPPRTAFRPRVCSRCGAPITPNEAVSGGHCSAPACVAAQRRVAVQGVAARREAERLEARAAALRAAEPALAVARAALGGAPGDTLTMDVPFTERRLAPADRAQQAAFLAHLEGVVAAGFALPAVDDEATDEADAAAAAPQAAGVAACAACRGWCCQHGAGRMAFLSARDIARQRARRPEADAAAMLALYRDALPDRSLHGSCVYHGAQGCVLPRTLRAETCNAFRCFELREIDQTLARSRKRRLMAVARNGPRPRAFGAVDLDRAEREGLSAVRVAPIGGAPDGGD